MTLSLLFSLMIPIHSCSTVIFSILRFADSPGYSGNITLFIVLLCCIFIYFQHDGGDRFLFKINSLFENIQFHSQTTFKVE